MDESLSAAIGGVLEAAVSGGAVPGAVAIVVDRDGTRGARGRRVDHASDGEGAPLGPDARFRIASMTKALDQRRRAAAGRAGQARPRRRGRLDRPGLERPAGARRVGRRRAAPPRARRRTATIRQLLTHTAGPRLLLRQRRPHEVPRGHRHAERAQRPAARRSPRRCRPIPGTRWEYGINTDWLGLVVEAVSGQTLDAYLADHLFTPLGMNDTSFAATPE